MTIEEILRLAPDEASARTAKGLVLPGQWPSLGRDEGALWGECRGSGSHPYQVRIDRTELAFKCSCPSRKFPCKHGLALLLLAEQHPTAFATSARPTWVSDWLATRQQRAGALERKKEVASEGPALADPKAQEQREQARRQRMRGGMEELRRWLEDSIRQGLAQLAARPQELDRLAARMVDAQLPGLEYRLRRLAAAIGRGEHWPRRVLADFGQLQLLVEGFQRLAELPPETRLDLETALGRVIEKDEVLRDGARARDRWRVLGVKLEERDRLWVRRTWLHGDATRRTALLLDYAHGARRFDFRFRAGSCLEAQLAFYPGAATLRALVSGETAALSADSAGPPAVSLHAALEAMALSVSLNPWQWPQPMLVSDGIPEGAPGRWRLRGEGGSVPLDAGDDLAWRLVAEGGGRPLTLFGEWADGALRPLTAWGRSLVWSAEAEAA